MPNYSGIQSDEIISNVRYDWNDLEFPRFRRIRHAPKRLRPNSALDTETNEGRAFLIADDRGSYVSPEYWLDIEDWLFEGERWRYSNFCFNLDYDVRAMLAFLEPEIIEELWLTGECIINDTKLAHIPKKYFSLHRDKHKVELFDLAQFYHQSLDNAAWFYLKSRKHKIDAERIESDISYVLMNWEPIIEYCIQDARLTKRLADVNQEHFADIGVRSNKWYSPAYISEQYFLEHTRFPTMHFVEPQRYAYYSYAGGRFEVFKRGYSEQIYKYDIRSAYPHRIRDLPDLDSGEWHLLDKYDENADMAFLKIKIRTNEGYVQPLHYKNGSLVVYPEVGSHLRIITKSEYELMTEYDLADITLIDGWHFYNTFKRQPFKIIQDIYDRRQVLKDCDDPQERVLKVVMNSIYGKKIQINPLRDDEIKHRVGNLFTPAYASVITADTRVRLVRECIERDLRPLAFFTDAIVLEDKTNLGGSGLGSWGIEDSGEAVFLGSGVYSIRDKGKVHTRLRGFRATSKLDLFELLERNSSKSYIPLSNLRPVTIGEFIYRSMHLTGITLNMWLNRQKNISINFDRKRIWERDFANCADALSHQMDSLPLAIS